MKDKPPPSATEVPWYREGQGATELAENMNSHRIWTLQRIWTANSERKMFKASTDILVLISLLLELNLRKQAYLDSNTDEKCL